LLSETIHFKNGIPIICDLFETFRLSDVNQSQNIFFEATSTEPDTTVQKLITNSAITGNAFFYFFNVGLGLLTQNSDTVD
jgi:hypothetical protein